MMDQTSAKLYAFSAGDKMLMLDVSNHRLYQLYGDLIADVVSSLVERQVAVDAAGSTSKLDGVFEDIAHALGGKYDHDSVMDVLYRLGRERILQPAEKAIASIFAPAQPGAPLETVALVQAGSKQDGQDWRRASLDRMLELTGPAFSLLFVGPGVLRDWPAVRSILEFAPSLKDRAIRFVMDVEPELVTDPILEELKRHNVALRVSIDGATLDAHADEHLKPLIEKVAADETRYWLLAQGSSMWPTITDGELVRIERVDSEQIVPGDIVAFERQEGTIIHRIIERVSEGNGMAFLEKGDNSSQVSMISPSVVLGRVVAIQRGPDRVPVALSAPPS